ncbi:MAG: hypothetical protein H7Y33_03970 [Cytophagales bacterium]|nr:hypothetical protein [Rhizobacter sp.]
MSEQEAVERVKELARKQAVEWQRLCIELPHGKARDRATTAFYIEGAWGRDIS